MGKSAILHMTSDRLRGIYNDRLHEIRQSIRILSRLIGTISLLRLGSAAAAIYFLVRGIRTENTLFFGAALLMGICFLWLVGLHNRRNNSRKILRELESLNETELDCLEHRFGNLPDGAMYADRSHPWSHDLDIFGEGSLFQYMNRTATLKGSELLARQLTTEPEGPAEIRLRQEIHRDLSDRIGFRQDFTARARLIRENRDDLEELSRWLSAKTYISSNRWLFPLALGVSAISVTILILGITDSSYFNFYLPLLLFSWAMLAPFLVRTNRYQSDISRKNALLEGYAALLKIIAEAEFGHPDLKHRQNLARAGQHEVKRLSKLLNLFDQRLNMLLGVVFNSLFLFDFIMLHLLERWKRQNRDQIMQWIELTALMDARISLAGFAFNHPGYVYPVLEGGNGTRQVENEAPAGKSGAPKRETGVPEGESGEPGGESGALLVEQLGHPLIPGHRRVDNNLAIGGEKVVIITGANMAGKSTFLRSLGVNTVLAYAGCPVCAEKFRGRFTGLHSSMRTADSLKEEESYFLAEIKRLEQIVHRMEKGEPLLILLDEVLKGTNTTDKRLGSVGLIEKSLGYPILCFIATHDLSLGDLEQSHPGRVVNYCFESTISEMELYFDYTIRRGIARNMNASFLMRKMGIMD